jgi:hypothetical protein
MINLTIVPTVEVSVDRTPPRKGAVPFSDLLTIARELLDALGDATRPGQLHVMHRVLSILQHEMLSPSLRLSEGQVAAVMAAVTELEHEAGRNAPDTEAFIGRARVIVDLLSIA